MLRVVANVTRQRFGLNGVRRDAACGLADIPLDRVEAIAAVRDMRRADVLARGEQVVDAPRNQCAQRNLKRQRTDVNVIVAAGAHMQVDAVRPDANRIRKWLGGQLLGGNIQHPAARLGANVLLEHRELRLNAARLPDIWRFCQAIGCPDDVWPEPQSTPSCLAIGTRSFRLQPVQQRQTG